MACSSILCSPHLCSYFDLRLASASKKVWVGSLARAVAALSDYDWRPDGEVGVTQWYFISLWSFAAYNAMGMVRQVFEMNWSLPCFGGDADVRISDYGAAIVEHLQIADLWLPGIRGRCHAWHHYIRICRNRWTWGNCSRLLHLHLVMFAAVSLIWIIFVFNVIDLDGRTWWDAGTVLFQVVFLPKKGVALLAFDGRFSCRPGSTFDWKGNCACRSWLVLRGRFVSICYHLLIWMFNLNLPIYLKLRLEN